MVYRTKKGFWNRKRRGAAVAELAVCLPTIALFLLGSIECCNMIFLQQALSVSAYEGARTATRRDSTNANVQANTNTVLTSRRVKSATVTITPADVTQVPAGTKITISVSTPCAANSYLPPWFFANRTLVARCSMVRE